MCGKLHEFIKSSRNLLYAISDYKINSISLCVALCLWSVFPVSNPRQEKAVSGVLGSPYEETYVRQS